MPYTGGELNRLNGKYGISAPEKSVPVMQLIRRHRPRSRSELYALIRQHHLRDCPCGVKSRGTIEDFGRRLYEAQQQEWGRYKYTLRQCIRWEYDLFIVQSLKGNRLEKEALRYLRQALPGRHIRPATGWLDETLRIDLVICPRPAQPPLAGIQIKPHSYHYIRANVRVFNRQANARWNRPVFYLFYDERGRFLNLQKVTEQVWALR